jgi:hypothetical protein
MKIPMQPILRVVGTAAIVAIFLAAFPAAHATEFRMGVGLPVSSIVGTNSSRFKMGVGFEAIMDIQTDRESSYYINVSTNSLPGSDPATEGASSEIILRPDVSWWGFNVGAAYYPLRRKEGTTPVLAADYGFQFVTEKILQEDLAVGTSNTTTNSLMFQSLGFSVGVEHQVNTKLSVHGRGKININVPMNAPKNYSIIYSNSEYSFIVAQIVIGTEFRFGK